MLQWRKIHISVGGKSTETGCLRECPQGEVLSPLLWLLVADTLLYLQEDTRALRKIPYVCGDSMRLHGNSADNLQLVPP